MIASVPIALRAARELTPVLDIGRVLLCTESPGRSDGYGRHLDGLPWTEIRSSGGSSSLAEALDADAPVLVLAPYGLPDPGRLVELLAPSMRAQTRTTWIWHGAPVLAYYPEARTLLKTLPDGCRQFPRQSLTDCDTHHAQAPSDSWSDVSDPTGVGRVERRLLRSLGRPSDGYLARLDRTVSIAISRRLIPTRITPNAITGLSLIAGLGGAALLAFGTSWVAVLGVLLLWASSILDGCDGELARLKLLTSRFGAQFDVVTDHVVHAATFVGVAIQVHRTRPDMPLAAPVMLLLVGVALSMASVVWMIDRVPPERRDGLTRVYERIASRDYVYILLVLTALGRIEWFLWGAALGANLFWLSLWWWVRAQRSR
jgi:phosphatidylglycerophosphate synthase